MRKKILVGAALSLLLGLSGCASGGPKDEAQPAESGSATGSSQKADVLTIGMPFNPTDSLDPNTATSPGSMFLLYHVYDSLAIITEDGPVMHLAKSIEPSPDAKEWTVTLVDGVKDSGGTVLSGRDVIDSLQHMASSPNYQSMFGNIDFAASSAQGNSAKLILKAPASDFLESTIGMFSPVSAQGKFAGVGAGAFQVVKGDPATGYELKPFDGYFAGKAKLGKVIVKNIIDSASQANALKSGEIDYAWVLDPSSLASLKGVEGIKQTPASLESATVKQLVLNTRVAPFNDPEVRRAAKLTIDREKMVKTLLGESGEVANDMLGKGYPTYPDDIAQTKMNREEAKKIFAAKGVKEFTIIASDIVPGLVAASEYMVQDFAAVGVKVTVEKKDPQSFFSDMAALYQAPAFTFYWVNRMPIAEFRSEIAPDSPYNVSGYTSPTLADNFAKATATLDEAEQEKYVKEILREIHDEGGELIWGYQKQLSAYRSGLEDVYYAHSVPWLTKATFTPAS